MKIGDLLQDKEFPQIVGIIFKIDIDKKELYSIFCEGRIITCDFDYIQKYCEIISESR